MTTKTEKHRDEPVAKVGWETPEEWALEQRVFHSANDDSLPEETRILISDVWQQYTLAADPHRATPPEKHRHTNDEGYEIVGTTFDGVEVLKPAVPSENFTPEQVQAAIEKHIGAMPDDLIREARAWARSTIANRSSNEYPRALIRRLADALEAPEKHRHTAEGVRWSDHHGTIRCASYSCERYALNYMEAGGVGSYYCNECRIEIEAAIVPARHTAEVEALRRALMVIQMTADGRDALDGFPRGKNEKQRRLAEIYGLAAEALATQPTPTTAEKP